MTKNLLKVFLFTFTFYFYFVLSLPSLLLPLLEGAAKARPLPWLPRLEGVGAVRLVVVITRMWELLTKFPASGTFAVTIGRLWGHWTNFLSEIGPGTVWFFLPVANPCRVVTDVQVFQTLICISTAFAPAGAVRLRHGTGVHRIPGLTIVV